MAIKSPLVGPASATTGSRAPAPAPTPKASPDPAKASTPGNLKVVFGLPKDAKTE